MTQLTSFQAIEVESEEEYLDSEPDDQRAPVRKFDVVHQIFSLTDL
jgi:hypothetical protein